MRDRGDQVEGTERPVCAERAGGQTGGSDRPFRAADLAPDGEPEPEGGARLGLIPPAEELVAASGGRVR